MLFEALAVERIGLEGIDAAGRDGPFRRQQGEVAKIGADIDEPRSAFEKAMDETRGVELVESHGHGDVGISPQIEIQTQAVGSMESALPLGFGDELSCEAGEAKSAALRGGDARITPEHSQCYFAQGIHDSSSRRKRSRYDCAIRSRLRCCARCFAFFEYSSRSCDDRDIRSIASANPAASPTLTTMPNSPWPRISAGPLGQSVAMDGMARASASSKASPNPSQIDDRTKKRAARTYGNGLARLPR